MPLFYYIVSALFIIVSVLPFIPNQHWMFRVWEFGRIQMMFFHLTILIVGIIFVEDRSSLFWISVVLHISLIINNLIILSPYIPLKGNKSIDVPKDTKTISILSVNVYQFNDQYEKLINLVNEVKPDILLTMESNHAWEDALTVLEDEYPNSKKVPLENTYGIHFYTKLPTDYMKVNYFVADDLPSIEASLVLDDGSKLTFFGVHPPPPSPTEEDNSKERDGELLSVGKKILEIQGSVIVTGDFNNVAWAKSSILFRNTSKLIDPRIGRGFIATYHAKYRLLRFPIDLFFHSPDIFVEDFKTLRPIGSDHLPLFCKFFINQNEEKQEDEVETLEEGEEEEVEELIEEGIKEEGDRDVIATE